MDFGERQDAVHAVGRCKHLDVQTASAFSITIFHIFDSTV